LADARAMIEAGANRIGASATAAILSSLDQPSRNRRSPRP
jgi:deoxyribose-phosphate aldolase